MARVYATADDYQAYTGQTPPASINQLLAQASRFLDANVFRLCFYDADQTTGMPTEASVTQAFTDATCAQAQWWDQLGDSIGAVGAGWGEVRIGSVHLSRSVTNVSPAESPARQIAPQVMDVLSNPDLSVTTFRIGEIRSWSWDGSIW